MTDEKLASARVLAGMGHGQRAGDMLMGVAISLAFDGVAGAAGADPWIGGVAGKRIAALDHEIGDDPVKAGAIVEALVGELLEIGDRAGCFILEQLCGDGALGGLDGSGFRHCKPHGRMNGSECRKVAMRHSPRSAMRLM